MKVITVKDNVSEFIDYVKTVTLAHTECLFLSVSHRTEFEYFCGTSDCSICNQILQGVETLLDRIESLNRSEYKLKRFAFYSSSIKITRKVVLRIGRLSHPPALAVDVFNFDNFKDIGGIMRLYFHTLVCGAYGMRNIEAICLIPSEVIALTNLIDVGTMQSVFHVVNNWTWKVEYVPQDTVSISYNILDAHSENRKGRFSLNTQNASVGYYLRLHRDCINSLNNAKTWMVLGHSQQTKRCYLNMLTKDCLRVIFSHLSATDWAPSSLKKSSVTLKTSVWSTKLIQNEINYRQTQISRETEERVLSEMEEHYRTYQKRHADQMKRIRELKKAEDKNKPNVEFYRKKIKRI